MTRNATWRSGGLLPAIAMACASAGAWTPAARAAEPGPLQAAIGDPDHFHLTASARLRFESIDNQFRPGLANSDEALFLRTLIEARYEAGPVDLVAELEDARAYGESARGSVGVNEVNALELLQGYVRVRLGDGDGDGGQKPAAVQVGRFTMDLGGRRLVGRNQFRNAINGFTGARLIVPVPGLGEATAFYTLPNVRLPGDQPAVRDNAVKWDRESFDLQFWGGALDVPLGTGNRRSLHLSYLGLAERDRPDLATRNRHIGTLNVRLFARPQAGKFDYEIDAAWQFGRSRTTTAALSPRVPVRASLVHLALGYQADAPWQPRVALVFDRASGDGRDRRYGRFDSLFGVRRADFGPTGLYGALGRSNIVSPGFTIEAAPDKRWSFMAAGRLAWADARRDAFASTGVRDATGASGRFAGRQLEARVRRVLVPGRLQAELGGVTLLRGRMLSNAPNANTAGDPRYFYVQVEANL